MRVAQVRGAKLDPIGPNRIWTPIDRKQQAIAGRAITDVARALGYKTVSHYIAACLKNDPEVRRRLEALT